jgi:hypothetical protein
VADRGPGLTPSQAERAFERFYRADQARTAGGTGLGLAIVAALVAAHGGRVWVESPPAGGAIFRIALPLAPEALGHDAEQDQEQQDQEQQDQEQQDQEQQDQEQQDQEQQDQEQQDQEQYEQPVPGILDSAVEDGER